jgi:hypothetical protein
MKYDNLNTIRISTEEKKFSWRSFFARKQFHIISGTALCALLFFGKMGFISREAGPLLFCLCVVVTFLSYRYQFYTPCRLYFHSDKLVVKRYQSQQEILWEVVKGVDFEMVESEKPKMKIEIVTQSGTEIIYMENDIIDKKVLAKMAKFVMLLAFYKKSRNLLITNPIGEV